MSNNVCNTYKIESKLGQGSYGEVSLISNDKGELFAFKKIGTNKYGMTFTNEINILMSIRHDNILSAYKVYTNKNCDMKKDTGIVTELMSISLAKYLDKKQPYRYRSDYKDNIIKIMRDVYSGVYALHDMGIIHLDIKPDNILIKTDDKGNIIKAVIGDLGSCIYTGDVDKSKVYKYSIGSRLYEPIERLTKAKCSAYTDVYSLALSFIECFDGDILFDRFISEQTNNLSYKDIHNIYKDRSELYDLVLGCLAPYFNGNTKEMLIYVNMLCDCINFKKFRISMDECIKIMQIDHKEPELATYLLGNHNYDIIRRLCPLMLKYYKKTSIAEHVTLMMDIMYAHLSNRVLDTYPSDEAMINAYSLVAFKSLNKSRVNNFNDIRVFHELNSVILEVIDFEQTIVSDLNGLVNGDRPFYNKDFPAMQLVKIMMNPEEYVEYFNSRV